MRSRWMLSLALGIWGCVPQSTQLVVKAYSPEAVHNLALSTYKGETRYSAEGVRMPEGAATKGDLADIVVFLPAESMDLTVTLEGRTAQGAMLSATKVAAVRPNQIETVVLVLEPKIVNVQHPVDLAVDVIKVARASGSVQVADLPLCDGPCTQTMERDSLVTLSATPTPGDAFVWGGACAGRDAICNVTLSEALTQVSVRFQRANYVFATSTTHRPGRDFASVADADAICNARAQEAGLPGEFRAWLSSSAQSAAQHVGETGARGWLRPDEKIFTSSLEVLTAANQVVYPARLDERGRDLVNEDITTVWTGTKPNGEREIERSDEWTQETVAGSIGNLVGGPGTWTAWNGLGGERVQTNQDARLYCFGIDLANASLQPAAPATGRTIFVSRAQFVPGSVVVDDKGDPVVGIEQAHLICKQEARAAGLGGTFLALLSQKDRSAAKLVDGIADLPLVRPDGVRINASMSSLFKGLESVSLEAPIVVAADGKYEIANRVWIGAKDLGSQSGAETENCGDWSKTGVGQFALPGDATFSDARLMNPKNFGVACSVGARLLCMDAK